jgi:predicted DNA-binding transcriptional regulator AlpA
MSQTDQHQPPPWAAFMPAVSDARVDQLRLDAVLRRTGYSRREWYRAMKAGRAPAGFMRGVARVWSSLEIDAFNRWQVATLPPAKPETQRSRRKARG